ncbi:AmmeMemoRadiSam system radical SAM enzyme, partial [Candidatus Parcubacteria bacterium]|nr:AmmeMemoRadiSam system radical SAM enzyme [Candidatus Parcubacteria bacterium]
KSTTSTEEGTATSPFLKEANYYRQLEGDRVQCELCPNRCILAEGQRGVCKVRENRDGKLYSLVYGRVVTTHLDPIEKKPLYHFLPGAKAYSLATAGCSLACNYCQNWDIAQKFPEDLPSQKMSPQEVVAAAQEMGAEVVAFTYNEPVVWYEFMLDIAKEARAQGLKSVVITSGYINREPMEELLKYLDGVKIDLKGFNEDYYAKMVGGKLEPVLDTLKLVKESGTHLEIVTLLVPGQNDDPEEVSEMCRWILENLGDEVPLHFSRFHPAYKLQNLPPTPEETVRGARQTCLDLGLKYVYTGNIPDVAGSTTFCPDNGQPLVVRKGYTATENLIDPSGMAPDCPSPIPGVWH